MGLRAAGANFDIMREAGLRDWSVRWIKPSFKAYPHGRVHDPGNLIVRLQPGAAAQDLGEIELAHCSLHVADLALSRRGRLDPLRGLAADTADEVGIGESLGRTLRSLYVERRGDRLGDS